MFSSCASILNPKQQKLNIVTEHATAKVYVNGELAGEGEQIEAKLTRDMKVQQLKVEQAGFKPEYKVAFQTKKSPLYIMSWVPFAVLFFPPFMDSGPKSFNYKKGGIVVKPELSIVQRKGKDKYIYLKHTSFNVSKEDLVFKKYNSHNKYEKGKKESRVSKGKDDLKLNNTIFSDAIEDVLKKHGYTDTTRSVLKNKTNTIYLGAEVNNIEFSDIRNNKGDYTQYYAVGQVTINWTFYDVYGQTKFEKTTVSKSGEFSPNFYSESQDYVAVILEDAITASFFEVLKAEEVQKLLKEEQVEAPVFKPLVLKRSNPSSPVKTISEAQNATVTLKNKDGHGSGIIIDNSGYILTNFHVIANQEQNTKVILKGGEELACTVVRVNEYADLALLKVDKTFTSSFNLPTAAGYSAGMDVFAIGTPNSVELGQTLSKGIISGVRNTEDSEWIQTDVSVNPGNSGGALIDRNGNLLGVVNSKVTGFGIEGIAFCIPAYKVSHFLSLSLE
jgi:S1-C subfamily serine protease